MFRALKPLFRGQGDSFIYKHLLVKEYDETHSSDRCHRPVKNWWLGLGREFGGSRDGSGVGTGSRGDTKE